MPSEILAALIALSGVGLSTIISFVLGRRQASLEVDKLRTELQSSLGSKLYARRMDVYPQLYEHLSALIKDLRIGPVSTAKLKDVLANIENWDTHNAIFFGAIAGQRCYDLRVLLAQLAAEDEAALAAMLADEHERRRLRRAIQELELALKHELGTYHFESPVAAREYAVAKVYSEMYESAGARRKGDHL